MADFGPDPTVLIDGRDSRLSVSRMRRNSATAWR